MAPPLEVFIALDVASAMFTLLVGVFFALFWSSTRDRLFLLFSAGFMLTALGFPAVTASQFNLGLQQGYWDVLRLGFLLGGAFVLLFAYMSLHWPGSARSLTLAGWASAGLSVLLMVLFAIVPPFVSIPLPALLHPFAHIIISLAFAACALFSSAGLARRPSIDRALVPVGFLFFALSNYTWLLVDLSASINIVPLVYVWRLTAIWLFMTALRLPAHARRQPDLAPA